MEFRAGHLRQDFRQVGLHGIDHGQGGRLSVAKNRHQRAESSHFKSFTYDELLKRDKVNLDIFWLKDESLEASENLPPPEVIAQEIVDDLQAALEQFAAIAEDLGGEA